MYRLLPKQFMPQYETSSRERKNKWQAKKQVIYIYKKKLEAEGVGGEWS